MSVTPAIIWFSQASAYSTHLVGEKGVDLGKLYSAKLPVPNGFILTAQTVLEHILRPHSTQLTHIEQTIDPLRPETVTSAVKALQKLVHTATIPDEISQDLFSAYKKLGGRRVVIRPSVSLHGVPIAHHTQFAIEGENNLFVAIKQVWQLICTKDVILYAHNHHVPLTDLHIAVVVQLMVDAEASGVLYTQNPDNGNKQTVVIDAVLGLGEYYLTHQDEADRYEVLKNEWTVQHSQLRPQTAIVTFDRGLVKEVKTSKHQKERSKLSTAHLQQLAQLAVKVQQFLFFPQHVEWALEQGRVFILETHQLEHTETSSIGAPTAIRPIVYGTPVNGGLISGRIRIVDQHDPHPQILPNDIIVTAHIPSHHIDIFRHAAGVIVDTPIYPQDVQHLGMPIIANTRIGTTVLKSRQLVTVHGQHGVVYDGAPEANPLPQSTHSSGAEPNVSLYVSSGEPRRADALGNDHSLAGVGMLRSEFMVAQLGIHPKAAIAHRTQQVYIDHLAQGIVSFCKAFGSRPVIYRFLDFASDEYRALTEGDRYEHIEKNPLVGYRGAYRQLSDTASFDLELAALQKVRAQGYTNVHLMFPFVRSVEEYLLLRHHTQKYTLDHSPSLQHWLMVDTPSVALSIDHFIRLGVSGVAIGARDLRILMTGADLPESELSNAYHTDPAFLQMLQHITQTAHAHNIPVMFCEHTLTQELLKTLLAMKIDRISVNAQQIAFTQATIAILSHKK